MAPPNPLPTYVYKITPTAPPSPIPTQYPLSELDQKDGFIHLSIAKQIPITAGLFFKDSTTIWVLKLRFKPEFYGATNWDTPGCPHLYGNFGADDVEEVEKFSRSEGASWEDVLGQSGFLV
ncbi:hypothetical protein FHL15_003970 [Xylaria flabelliformis]|uniref:DUF952 domain-containing protein n=1 Tax=Xylaria flabelliformis TaxID=2512241 RepID=A0A553I4Z9_9PEZI|nr:hypothetical protein FHL15_003970 [Xylaria flabelliformis]